MLGHGRSGKPRSDYSLAGFANGMRDLLTVLQIEHATVVGHSMGGGVAIQFAYQFPELADRLVLVASGGFGPEVSWVVRGLTVPGAGTALGAASMWPWRPVVAGGLRLLARTGGAARPRPRRNGRRLRGSGRPAGESSGAACRVVGRGLAWPGRKHDRSGVPQRGAPDVHHLGRRRPGVPGHACAPCRRARTRGRGARAAGQLALPAQGPPGRGCPADRRLCLAHRSRYTAP
ncbi:MAG: alpha/beta fold hydrolase [Actinomycetota bacterium]|nr:alpha/beta fold hydrolase [Actinomycetota bacterium]